MKATITRLLQIISPNLRRRFTSIQFHAVISALVDTCAFALLYPLLRILTSYSTSKNWLPVRIGRDIYGATDRSQLILGFGITIVIFFVLSSIIGIWLTKRQSEFVSLMEEDVSTHLFEEYMEVPYLNHVSRNSAELVRNTHNIPVDIGANGMLSILVLTQNALVIALLVALIAIVSPVVVAVSVCYFGAAVYFYARFAAPRAALAGRKAVEDSGECIKVIQEGFGGLKAFRSGNATSTISNTYRRRRRKFADDRYKMTLYSQLPQYYLQSVMIGGIVLFVLVVVLLHTGDIAAVIGVIVASFLRLFPSLYTTLNSASKLRAAQGSVDMVYEDLRQMALAQAAPATRRSHKKRVMRLRTEAARDPSTSGFGIGRLQWSIAISFQGVGFHYPSSEQFAVRDLSVDIPKGSFVGIVGPTGAGKTTIVDLLLGLFSPTQGSILIDDQPLDGEMILQWRSLVGYVPQEVFLVDGSVRENIVFGSTQEDIDDDGVWDVLEKAQLNKYIEVLPERLDARLGERGVKLSGGQRQRIGIARALYRNPDVLILDEATSSLDVGTEAAVTATVESLGSNLTRIAVAHRLSTVRSCDDLLLMKDGHLVGRGDFGALRAQNDFFKDLADLARID